MMAASKPWSDPRDGAGVRRVVLCDACAAKRRGLRRFPLGVLAGKCDGCGGAYCACHGGGCSKDCPRREAKKLVRKVIAYFAPGASK